MKFIFLKVLLFQKQNFSRNVNCQTPVAHACNSSYSGGRDQEDWGSKPGSANSSQAPMSKNPITKKDWWSGSSANTYRASVRVWVQNPSAAKKKENQCKPYCNK
jgi:hypothetical protein